MKRWKSLTLGLMLFMAMAATTPARAITIFQACNANTQSQVCKSADSEKNATDMVKKIIGLLLFALGMTAVLMIIWSGVKYVTSRGDPAGVKSAKDTMTYAVIGLIVAMMAYSIVYFITGSFK